MLPFVAVEAKCPESHSQPSPADEKTKQGTLAGDQQDWGAVANAISPTGLWTPLNSCHDQPLTGAP